MDQNYALIVAGGKGVRMNASVPKQFIPLEGLPVLMHTLNAYHSYDHLLKLVLVLPSEEIENWHKLCKEYDFSVPHLTCEGGKDRTESVRNGLNEIDGNGLVAIHDGVRPFVNNQIIHDSYFHAGIHGNAIAAVKPKDSLRRNEGEISVAVDRQDYRIIQTPQTFRISLIKKAYEILNPNAVSDDATVLEKYGEKIFLFEGSYENIKITTPEDVELANLILKRRKKK